MFNPNHSLKIAVIGSGISGLASAAHLAERWQLALPWEA